LITEKDGGKWDSEGINETNAMEDPRNNEVKKEREQRERERRGGKKSPHFPTRNDCPPGGRIKEIKTKRYESGRMSSKELTIMQRFS
jgi:hypothetical protein